MAAADGKAQSWLPPDWFDKAKPWLPETVGIGGLCRTECCSQDYAMTWTTVWYFRGLCCDCLPFALKGKEGEWSLAEFRFRGRDRRLMYDHWDIVKAVGPVSKEELQSILTSDEKKRVCEYLSGKRIPDADNVAADPDRDKIYALFASATTVVLRFKRDDGEFPAFEIVPMQAGQKELADAKRVEQQRAQAAESTK